MHKSKLKSRKISVAYTKAQEVISEYATGVSMHSIALKYNTSVRIIKNILTEAGVVTRDRLTSQRTAPKKAHNSKMNTIKISTELISLVKSEYDSGKSLNDIKREHSISMYMLLRLSKEGYITTRSRGDSIKLHLNRNPPRLLSEEVKKKISASRKLYLQANPDKVPYRLNHYSKGASYPEQYFTEWLRAENIQFEYNKPVGQYSLDFVIGNIDLEIDGEQHYVDKRIVASDVVRTQYIESLGYKTIRVRWRDYIALNIEQRAEFLCNLKHQLLPIS